MYTILPMRGQILVYMRYKLLGFLQLFEYIILVAMSY